MPRNMKITAGNQTFSLDKEQAHLLACGMRIAAEHYVTCAKISAEANHPELAQQFRRQETQAREIVNLLADLGYC